MGVATMFRVTERSKIPYCYRGACSQAGGDVCEGHDDAGDVVLMPFTDRSGLPASQSLIIKNRDGPTSTFWGFWPPGQPQPSLFMDFRGQPHETTDLKFKGDSKECKLK